MKSNKTANLIFLWYLVKEGHVYETVVEHQGFLSTQQFSE